ncbi:extracellular solute-binding protein [Paenibacillus albidus]|uniref:extracellular solute-binding protein n=1 Tax=Paenibacillus albidus TaxID=2041023 RepID=UPI002035B6D6|nr:extracellular solute-binding protein [Paenibacillus albidus]
MVDVIFDNAQDSKMTTDYATQIADFASGKAAMMLQGNWTQGDIDKIDPALELGILPLPISDKEGSILVGVPNNYIDNSKSEHPEEAKAFLNWMVTSETGQTYLTKEFKFIPAETNIETQTKTSAKSPVPSRRNPPLPSAGTGICSPTA